MSGFWFVMGGMVLGGGDEVLAPRVVGVPSADGGRGLVRVDDREIRHYSGDWERLFYLVSEDNGETWTEREAPDSYTPNFGGIPKEAPGFARNPRTGEWIRIRPVRSHVFHSRGGIDGEWLAVTRDGGGVGSLA